MFLCLWAYRVLFLSAKTFFHAESDARYGGFDFRAAHAEAPADLQDLLDQNESLPFRRRGYERDGVSSLDLLCSSPALLINPCAARMLASTRC